MSTEFAPPLSTESGGRATLAVMAPLPAQLSVFARILALVSIVGARCRRQHRVPVRTADTQARWALMEAGPPRRGHVQCSERNCMRRPEYARDPCVQHHHPDGNGSRKQTSAATCSPLVVNTRGTLSRAKKFFGRSPGKGDYQCIAGSSGDRVPAHEVLERKSHALDLAADAYPRCRLSRPPCEETMGGWSDRKCLCFRFDVNGDMLDSASPESDRHQTTRPLAS